MRRNPSLRDRLRYSDSNLTLVETPFCKDSTGSYSTEMPVEAQFMQSNAIETTIDSFLGIAWSLSGVPGRKWLIWATGGFPFALDSPSTVPGGYLSLLYKRTMLALNDAQISIYPVDIRGLANSPSFVNGKSSGAFSGAAVSRQISNRMWLQQSKTDTLNDFADMTGGKAFYNTNDLAGSFNRAADDASSYYMLGYYLDTKNNKPGWRKLQVKVGKKDVEVRARNGFFVTNATMNPLLSTATATWPTRCILPSKARAFR
jgi:VWFA-related protein